VMLYWYCRWLDWCG